MIQNRWPSQYTDQKGFYRLQTSALASPSKAQNYIFFFFFFYTFYEQNQKFYLEEHK